MYIEWQKAKSLACTFIILTRHQVAQIYLSIWNYSLYEYYPLNLWIFFVVKTRRQIVFAKERKTRGSQSFKIKLILLEPITSQIRKPNILLQLVWHTKSPFIMFYNCGAHEWKEIPHFLIWIIVNHFQRLGSVRGEDLPYIFGLPLVLGMPNFSQNFSRQDMGVAEAILNFVTNFCKTGDPNEAGHQQVI